MKYKVITYHGEGRTLYYIARVSTSDELEWEVVATSLSRGWAIFIVDLLNKREKEGGGE